MINNKQKELANKYVIDQINNNYFCNRKDEQLFSISH